MGWCWLEFGEKSFWGAVAQPSEFGSYSVTRSGTVNFQNRKMSAPQNIVGSRIRALRRERGLTQAMLAARCGMLGWDVGENVVTKIETQIRCVIDVELLCLAKALDVSPEQLLPSREGSKPVIKSYFREHL